MTCQGVFMVCSQADSLIMNQKCQLHMLKASLIYNYHVPVMALHHAKQDHKFTVHTVKPTTSQAI